MSQECIRKVMASNVLLLRRLAVSFLYRYAMEPIHSPQILRDFFDAAFAVSQAKGKHLFPFRTQKLSPPAPMVVRINTLARVGRCRVHCTEDIRCYYKALLGGFCYI